MGLWPLTAILPIVRKPEEALQASENKYRSLVNNVSCSIRSTTGDKGRFPEVNKAMEEVNGYSREELLQMSACDLYANPKERGRFIDEVSVREKSMGN